MFNVGFDVFTPVVMKFSIFWDIAPYSPLIVNWRSGGTCLHFQGRKISQARNHHEAGTKTTRRYVPQEIILHIFHIFQYLSPRKFTQIYRSVIWTLYYTMQAVRLRNAFNMQLCYVVNLHYWNVILTIQDREKVRLSGKASDFNLEYARFKSQLGLRLPTWGVWCLSSVLPSKCRDSILNRPRPLPSISFPIHHWLI
jgi:hypothetical protein